MIMYVNYVVYYAFFYYVYSMTINMRFCKKERKREKKVSLFRCFFSLIVVSIGIQLDQLSCDDGDEGKVQNSFDLSSNLPSLSISLSFFCVFFPLFTLLLCIFSLTVGSSCYNM